MNMRANYGHMGMVWVQKCWIHASGITQETITITVKSLDPLIFETSDIETPTTRRCRISSFLGESVFECFYTIIHNIYRTLPDTIQHAWWHDWKMTTHRVSRPFRLPTGRLSTLANSEVKEPIQTCPSTG